MKDSDETAELYNDSLMRCLRDQDFIKKFYTRFFAADPDIRRLFATTNMQQQEDMLKASLFMIMLSSTSPAASDQYLSHTALTHNHRHIPAHLYDIWLECLIDTVADVDTKFDESLETAWRTTMQVGVNYMKSRNALS